MGVGFLEERLRRVLWFMGGREDASCKGVRAGAVAVAAVDVSGGDTGGGGFCFADVPKVKPKNALSSRRVLQYIC